MDKEPYITCPYCGTEYTAAEIFIPKHFLGMPEDIQRTYDGRIKEHYGAPMNLTEKYTCDYCRNDFHVNASVKFYSYKDGSPDFREDYTSKIKVKKFFLFEN